MQITSAAFRHNSPIPARYTCEGEDINPPLAVGNIPAHAVSCVLIMDDPDAPARTWDHWIVFNIPVSGSTLAVKEDSVPGVQGWNSFGRVGYGGPCPPSGEHRYFFKWYALDIMLPLAEGARPGEVKRAMEGHVLAEAEMIGLYRKSAR